MILKNYFTIAFRHFWRNRLYAFINVFGLAVGISANLLLFMYLQSEWRYDHHHAEADKIFRLCLELKTESNVNRYAVNNFMLLPALKAHFPKEIQNYARVLPIGRQTVTVGEKSYNEDKVVFTDQSFLEIFDMPFLAGDKERALLDSQTVVISEAIAIKYFGNPHLAVGKVLSFPLKKYKITGVLKKHIPETHFQYQIYLSAPSLNKMFIEQCKIDISWLNSYNYLLLDKQTTRNEFQQKLFDQYQLYTASWFKDKRKNDVNIKYLLQSIKEIHLDTSYESDYVPPTNPMYLYILSNIGIFILLMACINYVNLATARAGQRAKEVGLRKVLGASRRQLLAQFLGESFILAFLSVWIGLAIAEVLLPNFNYLTEKQFHQLPWYDKDFWVTILSFVLIISLLSGIYPAIYLSSFPPTWVLQNKAQKSWHWKRIWLNPTNFRKSLVIIQFALSISMMIGTLVAYSQWDYMRTQPLGFEKENTFVIDIPVGDTLLLNQMPAIREKIKQNPQVIGCTVISTMMDGHIPKFEHLIPTEKKLLVEGFNILSVDENFIPLLGVEMKAGKNFLPTHPDSVQANIIINETLAKKMGWKNPVGKVIANSFLKRNRYEATDTIFCEVIGVVKDFHYQSLKHKIEPLVMYCMPKNPGFLMIKIKKQNIPQTQTWLRQTWQSLDPKHPIEAFDLATYIEGRYEPQGKLVTIFGYFSLLAIIISGLGLLGLISYLTEQRTKEIGIRRVLGASAGEVVRYFAVEFVWLVMFAFLLASPIVYTLLIQWLKDFAYHAQPSAKHFLIAGTSALCLAVITVSWLTWQVAKRKPSLALRYGG